MRPFSHSIFLIAILFVACSCTTAQTPTPAPTATAVSLRPTFTPLRTSPTMTTVPTETALPTPSPTATTPATDTPAPTPSPTEPQATATLPPPPTETPVPPTATSAPPSVPAVREGGVWDFEAGFAPWQNPYGEPCAGGALANGWGAFLTEGQFGSSCFNENKFAPNIHSGARSQEITFESIDATAGVQHTFKTVPDNRYVVSAWGIWHESPSPVILEIGIDPNGGQDWRAAGIQWKPWGATTAGEWHQVGIEFTAAGKRATVFLKARHPIANTSDPHPLRGGATLFDAVSIVDRDAE